MVAISLCVPGAVYGQSGQSGQSEHVATPPAAAPTSPPADEARSLDAAALTARAAACESAGQFDAAISLYRSVVDADPQAPQRPLAMLRVAWVHARLEQRREAQQVLEQFLADYPDSPHRDAALYQLGWLARRNEATLDHDDPWQQLHDDLPDGPYWAETTLRLGEEALAGGHPRRARKLIDKLLTRLEDSTHPPRQDANADTIAVPTASVAPNDVLLPRALYLAADLARTEEAWPQSITFLERLIDEYPAHPLRTPAEFWIAESYFRLGRYDLAQPRFERLAQTTQGRREAWVAVIPLRRGQLLAHLGHWRDALAFAEVIAEQSPDFPLRFEVDYLLGRCRAARGEMQQAREAYDRILAATAVRGTELQAMAHFMLGETYLHERRYGEALHIFLAANEVHDSPEWLARAALQAGKCYEMLRQWPQAVETYAAAAANYADTDSYQALVERHHRAVRYLRVATASGDGSR